MKHLFTITFLLLAIAAANAQLTATNILAIMACTTEQCIIDVGQSNGFTFTKKEDVQTKPEVITMYDFVSATQILDGNNTMVSNNYYLAFTPATGIVHNLEITIKQEAAYTALVEGFVKLGFVQIDSSSPGSLTRIKYKSKTSPYQLEAIVFKNQAAFSKGEVILNIPEN